MATRPATAPDTAPSREGRPFIIHSAKVQESAAPAGANQVAEGYSILTQVKIQVIGVLVTVAWTALVSAVAYKLVDLLIGLRVKEDAEREGLDVTSHGEKAYSL